tara:strand:- start:95 stop:304 length:210 start_codon:yes stop_codon:yes gene_type:complete
MISPINPQRDIVMKQPISKRMWLLFGYGITVSTFTLLMMFGLFGDLLRQNEEGREALQRLTMPPSTQIK